jgi:hypothetical protein
MFLSKNASTFCLCTAPVMEHTRADAKDDEDDGVFEQTFFLEQNMYSLFLAIAQKQINKVYHLHHLYHGRGFPLSSLRHLYHWSGFFGCWVRPVFMSLSRLSRGKVLWVQALRSLQRARNALDGT